MQPEASPLIAARASRDLQGHLAHLQSLFDDVQAHVSAHTPGGSAGRRRATDPGSPGSSSSAARLRSSLTGSPLRPMLLDGDACGSPPKQWQQQQQQQLSSPPAVLSSAQRAQHLRRRRSVHGSSLPASPADSYQRFAAKVFEERYNPLRLGLQREQQQQQQHAAPATTAPAPPQAQSAPAAARRSRQHAASLPTAGRASGTTAAPACSQQLVPGVPLHAEGGLREAPATPLEARLPACDQPGSTPPAACASAAPSSTGRSTSASFASEEGDAVLLASPGRGHGLSPAGPSRAASPRAGAAASPAGEAPQPASAGSSGGRPQLAAPSPLPLLSRALELLGGSAAGAAAASAAAAAAAESGGGAGQPAGGIAAMAAPVQLGPAEESSAAALQPLRLHFEPSGCQMHPDLPVQEQQHAAEVCSSRESQLQQHTVQAGSGIEPAAAAEQATTAGSSVAEQRPSTAGARAQALQRLKQRRLQQLQQEGSASAGGASSPLRQSLDGRLPSGAASSAAAADEQAASRGQMQQQQEQQHQQEQQQPLQRGGEAPPNGQQPQPGEQAEEGPAQEPRPFLRRKSRMIPMQKLPDWGSVRPRTSSRWEDSGSGSSRPSTPGGSSGSTPAGSRASTPRVPATAPPAQQRPGSSRLASSSRLGAAGGGGSIEAVGGSLEAPGVATYTLKPALARTGSRGRAAAQAASRAAQSVPPRPQRARVPQAGLGYERAQTPPAGRLAGGKPAPAQRSARTTPFAPRPNSGDGGWGTRSAHVQRPRGTPLYDASSLLPLSVADLMGPGGTLSGSGFDSGSGFGGSSAAAPELHAWQHGSARPGSSGAAGSTRPSSGTRSARPAAARPGSSARSGGMGDAAAAAGDDMGPLHDLLSQVDRMLRQVERAAH